MQNIHPEQEPKPSEPRSTDPQQDYTPRSLRDNSVLVGVALVIVGSLVLAKMIFSFAIPDFLVTWPMILIVVGILIGLRHRFTGQAWWIILVVGIFFFIDKNVLDLENFRGYLAPVLIIMAGILFIVRKRTGPDNWARMGRRFARRTHRYGRNQEPFTTPNGVTGDDVLDMTNLLGSSKQHIVSQTFKGGRITSILGSSEVNMTQANFADRVVIDIVTIMGGTEIIIPANWRVINQLTPILGGIDDKRRYVPAQEYTKTIILQGTVLLGGVDLKSY